MKQWILCIVIGLFSCASNLLAQDSLGVTKIGDLGDAWFDDIIDMTIQEPYLYVLRDADALLIFRLVEGGEPLFVGRNMSLLGKRLLVFDSLVVVWDYHRNDKVVLADVSNPADPQLSASIEFPANETIKDVQLFGGHYLAVACTRSGLRIYDIDNLSTPIQLTSFDTQSNGFEIEANGHTLYYSDVDSLYVLNAIIPSELERVNTYHRDGNILVQGERLYQCLHLLNGLVTYSLAEPTTLIAIGDTLPIVQHWEQLSSFRKIDASDRQLVVVSAIRDEEGFYDEYFDLNVFGLSDSGPTFQLFDTASTLTGSVAVGDSAFILRYHSMGYVSLRKLQQDHTYVGFILLSRSGGAPRLAISGSTLLTNRGGYGWSIYDISVPESPDLLNSCSVGADSLGFGNSNCRLSTDRFGFYSYTEYEFAEIEKHVWVNIEDPQTPGILETQDFLETGNCIEISGPDIYSARGHGWIIKSEIMADSSVVRRDSLQIPYPSWDLPREMDIVDSLLIINYWGSIYIVNTSGGNLSFLDSVALLPSATVFAINNHKICRALSGRWLQFVDFTNPLDIRIIGQMPIPEPANGVYLTDNHVFYSNEAFGLRIDLVQDLANVIHVGHYNTTFVASDVTARDSIVYLANHQQIFVLDASVALRTGIPCAPQQLITRISEDGNSIFLEWQPVTTDLNGRPIEIDRYEIYRRNSSSNEWVNIGIPTPQTATEYSFPVPQGGYSFAEFYVKAVQQ